MPPRRTLAAAVLAALPMSLAQAQHTSTVLFGEPSEAGLAVPAERQAVHPVTAPYFHEDSFVTTDIRAWYVHHAFPSDQLGGSANVYAVQIRAALTENLQLVAYKDGYLDLDTPIQDDGWNDLAAGLKWSFLQNWDQDLHAAVGIGYELGIGDDDVLQDDDELRLWASINKGFEQLHLGGTVNLLVPTGSEGTFGNSTTLSWHAHADYYINQYVSPVIELNGYHTLDDGDVMPVPFSGVDVANLGGGDGEDVITIGLGLEVRPVENVGLRAAYEMPLTDNKDLFGYRWTVSAVFEF